MVANAELSGLNCCYTRNIFWPSKLKQLEFQSLLDTEKRCTETKYFCYILFTNTEKNPYGYLISFDYEKNNKYINLINLNINY